MTSNLRIKTYSLSHVRENNNILFNVLNLYGDKQPDDYKEVQDKTRTEKWIDLFHNDYHTLKLTSADLKWMKEAKKINKITNKFSPIFEDELQATCDKYKPIMDIILQHGTNWFIKTEQFSLKYSVYGAGPYSKLEDIIKSITTFTDGHSSIDDEDTEKTIYFMPWVDITRDKEFRIFVYENKITAISSQYIYKVNNWLANKTPLEIQEITQRILDFFETSVKTKMSYLGSYVMDFTFVGADDTPYFIEPNPFGKDYSSGSALYHWIYDDEALHNNDVIDFRYVDKD